MDKKILIVDDDEITINDIHEINGTITNNEIKYFLKELINHNIEQVFQKIDEFDIKGKDFIKLTEEEIKNYIPKENK